MADEFDKIDDKQPELNRQAGKDGWYVVHTYAGYIKLKRLYL